MLNVINDDNRFRVLWGRKTIEILKLKRMGLSNREIAKKLNTSEGYVRVVLSRYKRLENVYFLHSGCFILECEPHLAHFLESFLNSEAFQLAFQDYVYELTFGRFRPFHVKIRVKKVRG